jgi:hypothetical protein
MIEKALRSFEKLDANDISSFPLSVDTGVPNYG